MCDWSKLRSLLWSGYLSNPNLVGPVPVPVFGLRAKKLDWTGPSSTIPGEPELNSDDDHEDIYPTVKPQPLLLSKLHSQLLNQSRNRLFLFIIVISPRLVNHETSILLPRRKHRMPCFQPSRSPLQLIEVFRRRKTMRSQRTIELKTCSMHCRRMSRLPMCSFAWSSAPPMPKVWMS